MISISSKKGRCRAKRSERHWKCFGFTPHGRHFVHPDTVFFVEFPTGPLMVGNQRVQHVFERKTLAGQLRLLSPTDCVKDRLAAFYHWNDRQSLEQAVLVAKAQKTDLGDIRRWSLAERQEQKFLLFERALKQRRRPIKRKPRK
jgi:hypothetical protein